MELTQITIIQWASIWLKSAIGALLASACLAVVPFVVMLLVTLVGIAIEAAS